MNDKENPKIDISRMASTEVPGKGEFFLYHDTHRWKEGDFGGSVWVVGPEAATVLAKGGIDAVLADETLKESAALLIVVQEKAPDNPGFVIDFYNNPNFDDGDLPWKKSNRAEGIVDTLAVANKKDPLSSSVREMLRGAVSAKAYDLEQNSDKEILSISCVFFHGTKDPQKVVENIFEGYQHQMSASPQSNGFATTIEVSLPISQFQA